MFLGIKEYLPSGALEIIATVLSTLAMVMFIVSAAIKNKKKVILNQSAAQVFLIFSAFRKDHKAYCGSLSARCKLRAFQTFQFRE